ncbi:proline racemase family protein [Ensifer sp. Root127]|uniref:proline racemase family protein n=1 Tax=Ensifer sp. Root127 TaxID=1736440 RepID=UPI00070BA7D2|nr:proline racemase family protein [Ensifer sp. Root127]KQW72440.1 proline racemase [Ensifer sp. Root127]
MRSIINISAIDSHTEGMPTRVVTGGVAPIPGATMSDRRDWAKENLEWLRGLLMNEPRGHSAMSGAVLQPPTRPDADWGVLYIEATGFLPMCGHGTMGVATVLVETGMVPCVEPVTTIRLDTPAGLVIARVAVSDGKATSVTLENVPALLLGQNQTVTTKSFGEVSYDMVYGGNFYPVVDAHSIGLDVSLSFKEQLMEAGRQISSAINETNPPVHPQNQSIRRLHHVQFVVPWEAPPAIARNAVFTLPGYFDRSPCGTGTSARMVSLYARGLLGVGEPFLNQSIIGSQFTGRILRVEEIAGHTAIVPEVTGRAWVTGTANYMLDPSDPFTSGFVM